MMHLRASRLAIALAATLTGCGAWPEAVPPVATAPAAVAPDALAVAPQAPAVTVPVTFRFEVPEEAARRVQYVSGGTRSITVSLASGLSKTVDVVSGRTTYETTLLAPIGEQIFTVRTFDGLQGAGNALATGSVTKTIVEGADNAVGVTLGGVVASLAVSVADTTPAIGPAIEKALIVEAKDATNRTIVGPYANPVTLGLAGNATSFALKNAVLTSSTATPTYTYTGAGAGTVTFGGAAEGLAPGNVTTVTLSPRVEATAITINQAKPALLAGESRPMTATVTYSNGSTNGNAMWFTTAGTSIDPATGLLVAGPGAASSTVTAVATGPSDTPLSAVVEAKVFVFSPTVVTRPAEIESPIQLTATLSPPTGVTGLGYDTVQTAGAAVTLNQANTLSPSFTTAVAGSRTFRTTITSAEGYTLSRDVTIDVLPHLNVGVTALEFTQLATPQTIAGVAGATYATAATTDATIATAAVDAANNRVSVTALKGGTTTLTITAADGRRATVTIYVTTTTFEIR
jgi:hypothetical protein